MFSNHIGFKLEITNCKTTGKSSNSWKLNTLLNNLLKRKSQGNFKKYTGLNKNENTHIKICGAQLNLTGKFIAWNVYIRKEERSQINSISTHLKSLEKEEQNKPKASRRKEITKLNEINSRKKKRENEWNQKLFFFKQ